MVKIIIDTVYCYYINIDSILYLDIVELLG